MLQFIRLHIICLLCCLHVFTPVARSQNVDIDLLRTINPSHPARGVWKVTSDSYLVTAGVVSVGPLIYALIKNDKELRYKSYEVLIAIGINTITTDGLKAIFNRPRPADQYPNDINVLTVSHGHSFPSGHTSLAFATATSLTLTYKKWYIAAPAYLWAGCMGYSRMYLGKHYPSDVLAGAILGTASGLLSNWACKNYSRKRRLVSITRPVYKISQKLIL